MAKNKGELVTLKRILSEADLIPSNTKLPEGRSERSRQLLRSAMALTDDLLNIGKMAAPSW
jgi:hypothetical protein